MFGSPIYTYNELKTYIDSQNQYEYKYWITLTWDIETQLKMKAAVCKRLNITTDAEELHNIQKIEDELEQWKVNQARRWFIDIAKINKSHLYPWWGTNTEDANWHFHAVILSEKRLYKGKSLSKWQQCKPVGKDWHVYNPMKGAIPYIYRGHYAVINQKGAFCPALAKSCRRGRCKHQQIDFIRDFRQWAKEQEVNAA